MNHRDLQKKQNKIALIFSLTFVLLLTIGIVGTILGFKNDLIIIGVLSVLIGFGGSIASMIYVIINTIKSNKIIYRLIGEEINNEINIETNKKEFFTKDGKLVTFDYNSFKLDDIDYKYSDEIGLIGCYSITRNKFVYDINISLLICIDQEVHQIQFDKDLLNEITDKNIPVVNLEDMKYLYSHCELGAKNAVKMISTNINIPYVPIFFEKNEEEKKTVKKIKKIGAAKLVLYLVVMFAVLIGFTLLINYLSDINLGAIGYNDFTASELVIKIVYSLVIVGLIIIKNNNKFLGKLSLALYVLTYWLCALLLPGRFNVFISSIFAIIFLVQGYKYTPDINSNNFNMNRYMLLSGFISIMIFASIINQCVTNILIAIILSILVPILLMTWLFIYKNKEYKKRNDKTYKVGNLVGLCIMGAFFIGINLYCGIISANAVFDNSEEIIFTEKVVELVDEDKHTSHKAVIIADDKELQISITKEMYNELKVDDMVTVVSRDGAFGIKYYQIKEK